MPVSFFDAGKLQSILRVFSLRCIRTCGAPVQTAEKRIPALWGALYKFLFKTSHNPSFCGDIPQKISDRTHDHTAQKRTASPTVTGSRSEGLCALLQFSPAFLMCSRMSQFFPRPARSITAELPSLLPYYKYKIALPAACCGGEGVFTGVLKGGPVCVFLSLQCRTLLLPFIQVFS